MKAFDQPTALVTGGGTGTGRAIALALVSEGFAVRIAGRREDKLRETAVQAESDIARQMAQNDSVSQGNSAIEIFTCDVSDPEQVQGLFAGMDRLDILVNCAGLNIRKRRLKELDPADWDRLLAVNVSGAFYCLQAALERMRPRRNGLIINVSSVAGKRAVPLAGAAYNASKFAMTGLGTTAGLEEAEHGIRVTNIYPGEMNTPILDERPEPVSEEHKAAILQPEDIAEVVCMLHRLPPRAHIPELVIKPLQQPYA